MSSVRPAPPRPSRENSPDAPGHRLPLGTRPRPRKQDSDFLNKQPTSTSPQRLPPLPPRSAPPVLLFHLAVSCAISQLSGLLTLSSPRLRCPGECGARLWACPRLSPGSASEPWTLGLPGAAAAAPRATQGVGPARRRPLGFLPSEVGLQGTPNPGSRNACGGTGGSRTAGPPASSRACLGPS